MTHPAFRFSPQFIQSGTAAPIDALIVWLVMLWPDSDECKSDYFALKAFANGKDRLESLDEEYLRCYTLATTRILERKIIESDLMKDLKRRLAHGFVCGEILVRALAGHGSLNAIKDDISSKFKRPNKQGGTVFQIQPQTLKNKRGPLGKFQTVRHLWAAFYLFHFMRFYDGPIQDGLSTDLLPLFLAAAERIRVAAEGTKLPKASKPLLESGSLIRIPSELRLPNIDLIMDS